MSPGTRHWPGQGKPKVNQARCLMKSAKAGSGSGISRRLGGVDRSSLQGELCAFYTLIQQRHAFCVLSKAGAPRWAWFLPSQGS